MGTKFHKTLMFGRELLKYDQVEHRHKDEGSLFLPKNWHNKDFCSHSICGQRMNEAPSCLITRLYNLRLFPVGSSQICNL